MTPRKDDKNAPLDQVRGNRNLAHRSGFIAKRALDLERKGKGGELVVGAGENGFECEWGREGSGPGEFRRPTAIAVDKEGNVLVADIGNRRIQKFDSNGRFLDAWGIDTDDSDEHASESDSGLTNLRIFVDDAGTISLIGQSGWGARFVGRLDSGKGVLRGDLVVEWYMLYGFVHPGGHTYILQEEGTSGCDEILRISTDGYITGRWGSRFWRTPELPYPMRHPLFSDINGDIYSLFPKREGLFPFPDFLYFGDEGRRSLHALVQDSALVMHLPTSRIQCGRNNLEWGEWGEQRYDSELLVLESSAKLCCHRDVGDVITIGRSPDNTIVIEDSTVSRHHARINFYEAEYHLEDLGSKNGTRLNGSNVTRARLGSQSTIKVGKETIKFFCPAWVPRLRQILSATAPEFVSDRDPFFVVDSHIGAPDINPVILKFSPECEPIEVWAPKLRDPHLETGSFAVNVDGGVFFLCGECNEVTELSPDGDLITRWGEKGTNPGHFDGPMGIAAGPTNEIYVADTGNHRIQKFRSPNKGGGCR